MTQKGVRENPGSDYVESMLEKIGKPEYERIEGRIHIALNSLDKPELVLMQERMYMESEKQLRKFSDSGWEENVDVRYFMIEGNQCVSLDSIDLLDYGLGVPLPAGKGQLLAEKRTDIYCLLSMCQNLA